MRISDWSSDVCSSDLQPGCRHPDRLLVGHPINPPYAVALVEVVGSAVTSAAAIDRACAFYRTLGKQPLRLDREVTGFVANRMQMALAREALQMIPRGAAAVAQVEHALMPGIGPRLARSEGARAGPTGGRT